VGSLFQKTETEKQVEKYEEKSEVADARIAHLERKKIERNLKKSEGKDWKKILGIIGKMRPRVDKEAVQTLYSMGSDLREQSEPGKLRKL